MIEMCQNLQTSERSQPLTGWGSLSKKPAELDRPFASAGETEC